MPKKTAALILVFVLAFSCFGGGTCLAASKKTALKVTTLESSVLDADRAVLLAKLENTKGYRIRQSGFYLGTSADKLTKKIKSNKLIKSKPNKLVTGLLPETQYYYQAYVVTSKGTYKGKVLTFTTPAKTTWSAEDVMFENTADRYAFLFGTQNKFYTKTSPPPGYANRAEAAKHMVKVSVPVWKIVRGKKVSSKMSISVNYKLKNSVKAIFDEIYALDIKFPIRKLSGFSYRTIRGPGLYKSPILSHHSFGAAVDINSRDNRFYKSKDKRNKKSPYCIPREVIGIFEKYGWYWGGDFKEGLDTMHFQYLGLDLTKR